MKFIPFAKSSARKIGACKNKNGFVAISFLTLVPLFLMGIFVLATVLQMNLARNKIENSCLMAQNQSFFRQRQRLIQLLKLNPEAKKLTLEKTATQLRIATAAASLQWPAVMALKIKLEKIILQQQALAQKQLQILMQADEEFLRRQIQIIKNIRLMQGQILRRAEPLWHLEFSQPSSRDLHLAVQPANSDIAPIYDLKMNFEEKQTWRVHWKMKMRSGLTMKRFLDFNYEVDQQCAMTLKPSKNTFSIVVPGKS